MDSLTQIALGAAIGEATLGRKVGNRAMVWGAVLGTLPDLDVFIPMGDAVRDFTYHRSFSHSLFVLTAVTPLLAWLILKLHPQTTQHRRGWLWLVFLVLGTHPLLDSFTVYGTQLFWPFYPTPVNWSTIFIIDPLYTAPLLVGVICTLVAGRGANWSRRINLAGLALSSLYLVWSVGAKIHIEDVARDSLAELHIESARLLSVPAPFNTVLWRVLVMAENGYYEGYYSLLDKQRTMKWARYPSEPALLNGLENHWPVQRLQWFTKGFYSVSRRADAVVMTDLRMGLEPDYIFSFKVGEVSNPHARPADPEMLPAVRNFGRLAWVRERIWSEDAVERR